MTLIESLRNYAAGKIDESTLQDAMTPVDDDISEYEADEKFMQECYGDCAAAILQSMILENALMDDEELEGMDESVKQAFVTLQEYFVGQGMMDEAASVKISNPKINVVHLNKQAQINRLSTIITLKMGRKANHKAYKKYKMGQKIKKTNLEQLKKLYGAKAERLAKKLWAKTRKSGKVAAVVDQKSRNVGRKK